MNELNFNFSEVFNSYENKIGQITLNYIAEIKDQNLAHYEMASFLTRKTNELEADLISELSQFANLYIDSTADAPDQEGITTNPIVLKSYVINLNKKKLEQLMAMYFHEADIILRRYAH